MKKWILIPAIILIVAVISIYIFIPNQLAVSNVETVHIKQSSALRYLSTKYQWAKWWTSANEKGQKFSSDSNNLFIYNDDIYEVKHNTLTGAAVNIYHRQKTVESNINIYSIANDSIAIQWKCNIATGFNPIKKLMAYNEAVDVKKNMKEVLKRFKSFFEDESNVYELRIEHEIIKDTIVIAQKALYHIYPSTANIYGMVDQLTKYALDQGAAITGQPMMNITVTDDSFYQTMVAIPVNKKLKDSGNIELKNLTPGTPMLSSIVEGGNYTTANTLEKLEKYKQDHQFTSPAIPYQILITDRRLETDTAKWKTKVCDLLFPWFK